MKVQNTFHVALSPESAWALLLDVPSVVPCMPGAELLAVEDARTYRGQVKVKLGPVAVAFHGRARFIEVDEDRHIVRVSASGTEGKGRGAAQADVVFRLSPDEAGTRVDIESDLSLVGAVAQYGRAQGVIADMSQLIVDTFAQNLQRHIAADRNATVEDVPSDVAAAAPTAALSLYSLFKGLVLRWFARFKGA